MRVKKESNMRDFTITVIDDYDSDYMEYDLNEICETADSTYWTLVPEEMFALWETPYVVKQGGMDDNILSVIRDTWE